MLYYKKVIPRFRFINLENNREIGILLSRWYNKEIFEI